MVHFILEFSFKLALFPFQPDSDWASDPFDRCSTTSYLMYLGYNPITWSAKKQDIVSHSSTESDYRALATTATELSWLRQVLQDLGVFLPIPPKLWCDNFSALAIASNPVFHACTKHVEVDYHFVKERVLRRNLQVKYIATGDQLADIFTKSLSTTRFGFLRSKIMVSIDPTVLRGDVKGSNLECTRFKLMKKMSNGYFINSHMSKAKTMLFYLNEVCLMKW